jgi:deoxyribose-phosphate aldolase
MVASNPITNLARHLDLTLCRADARRSECETLCAQAKTLRAAAVCVPGSLVPVARALLDDTEVKVSALVSFPLGHMSSDAKRYEIEAAADDGAHEFDVVANHGWLKAGEDSLFLREVRDLIEAADERPVKLIVEPGLLTPEELIRTALLLTRAEVHCLGLATGLGPRAAAVADAQLVTNAISGSLFLKATLAAGGNPEELIAAGVMRVGVLAKGGA